MTTLSLPGTTPERALPPQEPAAPADGPALPAPPAGLPQADWPKDVHLPDEEEDDEC